MLLRGPNLSPACFPADPAIFTRRLSKVNSLPAKFPTPRAGALGAFVDRAAGAHYDLKQRSSRTWWGRSMPIVVHPSACPVCGTPIELTQKQRRAAPPPLRGRVAYLLSFPLSIAL